MKIKLTVTTTKYGNWTIKNRVNYTDEELEIIKTSLENAKKWNFKERCEKIEKEKIKKDKESFYTRQKDKIFKWLADFE